MHEQLHVPRDITRNGSPRETYSGPIKHNHLEVKKASERTQRNQALHDHQVANRLAESYVIDFCNARMCTYDRKEAPVTKEIVSPLSSKGTLKLWRSKGGLVEHSFEWNTKTLKDRDDIQVSPTAIECIKKQYRRKLLTRPEQKVMLTIFTEYNREGTIFCAHPSYWQGGARHDWVMI